MYMACAVTYAIATPITGFIIDCGFPSKWMLLVGHIIVLIGSMTLGYGFFLYTLQQISFKKIFYFVCIKFRKTGNILLCTIT